MNCEQARPLIGPYADGELDVANVLELEKHIQTCAACAFAWRDLQSLKKTVKSNELYFAAPSELRRKLSAELKSQTGGRAQHPAWELGWTWLTTALASGGAVCLALLLVFALGRPSAQQRLTQELVSGHIRSLMADHVMDVASTDQHTVKPWFDGKLDFAPPVKDLATQEYPLVGGRLDYINGRSVAALVFQRNKHVINLFIWPAKDADAKPNVLPPVQGYHVVRWSQGGMDLWAVSDLNEKELGEFAERFAAP